MYIIEITEFIHSEELLQHTKTLILSRHNCDTQYHTSYSLQATQIPALMMITTATVMAHSFSLGAI